MGSQPQPHQQRLYILSPNLSRSHSRHGRILSCLTDGSDLRTIIEDLTEVPDGITIDQTNGHMYWTNMGHDPKTQSGSIERADLDGSNRKVIVPAGSVGVFTPKQIAIAKQAQKLYWCDREGMKVVRANLDGSDVEVLVSNGDTDEDLKDQKRWCVGIALDERRGYFYWTQKGPAKGGQGRIFRAPIDGPQGFFPDKRWDTEVVFDDLSEPIDLEMDEESQTLYWTDRGDPPNGNSLHRAAIGMGGVPQLLANSLDAAIGLAVDRDGDVAYVTDLVGGVYKVDIKTRKKKGLVTHLGDATGIALA